MAKFDIMEIILNEDFDSRCVSASLKQKEVGLSQLGSLASKIDCNEAIEAEELCNCVDDLNKMDKDFEKKKSKFASLKDRIRKKFASDYARDLIFRGGLPSLRTVFTLDSYVSYENEKCVIKGSEHNDSQFQKEFTRKMQEQVSENENIFVSSSPEEMKKKLNADYHFIKSLTQKVMEVVPSRSDIKSQESLRDIIHNVIFRSNHSFDFMSSESPLYNQISNEGKHDNLLISKIVFNTMETLRNEKVSMAMQQSSGRFIIGKTGQLERYQSSDRNKDFLVEFEIKNAINKYSRSFVKDSCANINASIANVGPDEIDRATEEKFQDLFNPNLAGSLNNYRSEVPKLTAGIIDKVILNKFGDFNMSEEEYNLLTEEYMYVMNSFYCHQRSEVADIINIFQGEGAEAAKKAAQSNAAITEQISELNKRIAESEFESTRANNIVKEEEEKLIEYEKEKKMLNDLIKNQGVEKINGEAFLDLSNSQMRNLYARFSGLSDEEFDKKIELFNETRSNTFKIPSKDVLERQIGNC